jgi:hypothetical protein
MEFMGKNGRGTMEFMEKIGLRTMQFMGKIGRGFPDGCLTPRQTGRLTDGRSVALTDCVIRTSTLRYISRQLL